MRSFWIGPGRLSLHWLQKEQVNRLVCSLPSLCIFNPPLKMWRRLPLTWLAYSEHEVFETGIRFSCKCLEHLVQPHRVVLEPPPSHEQSATLPWGSLSTLGSAITRGFAQSQTLGFGALQWGTHVSTCTLVHTLLYETLIAGCNTVMGERKTEFSAAYLPVDMTGNIDCCSHLPCTFITLRYRKGDDWEVGTCQLTSGTCPSTTRGLRYARGLKFHYRF